MPYRSSATATSTTATLTCSKPAGVVSGDVLIAIIGYYNPTAPITPPSGWTLGDSGSNGNNAGAWYRKAAGGSEPSTYSWTFTGSDESEVVILAYSGIDTTTPVGAYSKNTATGGDGGVVATGVTATNAGSLLFLAGTNAGYAIGKPLQPPSGMTERAEIQGASFGAAYAADLEIAAGATGDKTATRESGGTNTGPYTAFLVALNAASGGGGSTAKARRIQAPEGARILR